MPHRWKPNVTVAAVIERAGRFLLVEEDTVDGLRLNQPAGHLDPGESPAAGAARETLEETAYTFVPTALLGVYLHRSEAGRGRGAPAVSYLRFAFTGTVGEQDPTRALDHGIVRALWLTAEELRARQAEHRSALVMKCVEDYLAGRRHPLELVYTHASALG